VTEAEWIISLQNDGYSNLLFCDGIPGHYEDDHVHDRDHKMVIFSGDFELTIGYQTVHLGAHDYFEIPSGTNHTSMIGMNGCRYIIAERF